MRVLLLSTYELGRQPFGLASPAARLTQAGATVRCLDLAVQALDAQAIAAADLIAFYVPMHTATRLAARALTSVKQLNPTAHLCFYGLYAPVNEAFLRSLGAGTILGGEFEDGLVALVKRLATAGAASAQEEPVISLARQPFLAPDRRGLPGLERYAKLIMGPDDHRLVGYTEATRGCKHLCRHCPIVPVYNGRFRVVPREVVLEDIARQVAAGAQHITFGDPDFLNGPRQALPLVDALHARFPALTYDVTVKIEHLVRHAELLPALRDTGCVFVTSAVEAVDDLILEKFDKRHTRAEFEAVVRRFRTLGLTLNPTFVTFTPWTTLDGYLDLLRTLVELDLVANVAPVQYAIRLLIPAGSRLLELPDVQALVGPFDEQALSYTWVHPDSRVDKLYAVVRRIATAAGAHADRRTVFAQVWEAAHAAAGLAAPAPAWQPHDGAQTPVPFLSEAWFC
ncbi:MAG TPA: CUAEP/CCAEP-tail radical SAM protein [Dehalococcoidia bacterium]|nr:CUAEP/CCAEP-tail radical SAM protein [Dehalococcoidia bacterium]